MAPDEPRTADQPPSEDRYERLVSAVESLRPGTRRLSHGQQTVLVEYEHVVAQLSPPAFSPPAPEISDFEADGEKLRIYGKHLRQPIAVTVAGFRVPRFAFKEAAARKAAHLEAIVPPEAGAGPVVVLTSGGSAASARPFRAAETMVDAPSDAAPAPKSRARK